MTEPDLENRHRFQVDREPLTDIERSVGMKFAIDKSVVLHDAASGRPRRVQSSGFAEECVLSPSSIFGGLKRDNLQDALCYVARIPEGRTNFVLVSYAVIQDGAICFYDWNYRPEDPLNAGHPVGWRNDFGDRLWPI